MPFNLEKGGPQGEGDWVPQSLNIFNPNRCELIWGFD